MQLERGKKTRYDEHEIIASGSIIDISARTTAITLNTTYIGYRFSIEITLNDAITVDGIVDLLCLADGSDKKIDIKSSGFFYHDGTNIITYNYYYFIVGGSIIINFELRCLAGSYTFKPSDIFSGNISWAIKNPTFNGGGAGGGFATSDGKYCYYDNIGYSEDGELGYPLNSGYFEFHDGESRYFGRPVFRNLPPIGFKQLYN